MFTKLPDFNKETICSSDGYHKELPAFLFSNENVAGYISQFDMKGKTVLTVGASGDHLFECYAHGAKHVDTFDINYRQKPIMELKNLMIQHVPYEDFLEFFFDDANFFNPQIIEPIIPMFSMSLRMFMDLYYSMGSAGRKLFVYNGKSNFLAQYDNKYYSNQFKYDALGIELPKKISFTHTDITGISAHFTRKYDYIFLSNIFDFQHHEITDSYQALEHFYHHTILPLAANNLATENGTIAMEYLWGNSASTRGGMWNAWEEFSDKHNNKTHATGIQMRNMFLKAMLSLTNRDNVLYMTQNIETK